jgi:hypothetical protein
MKYVPGSEKDVVSGISAFSPDQRLSRLLFRREF